MHSDLPSPPLTSKSVLGGITTHDIAKDTKRRVVMQCVHLLYLAGLLGILLGATTGI